MRTTLDIDPDVLQAAREISRREKRTAGAVLSELARKGLRAGVDHNLTTEDFFGFEPTAPGGALVTNELVEELLDEDDL